MSKFGRNLARIYKKYEKLFLIFHLEFGPDFTYYSEMFDNLTQINLLRNCQSLVAFPQWMFWNPNLTPIILLISLFTLRRHRGGGGREGTVSNFHVKRYSTRCRVLLRTYRVCWKSPLLWEYVHEIWDCSPLCVWHKSRKIPRQELAKRIFPPSAWWG